MIYTMCVIENIENYEEKQDLLILAKTVRPLLHDLSVPATTLQGALNLIDQDKLETTDDKEALTIAQQSVGQLIRIIKNGKSVLQEKAELQNFYPCEIIQMVYDIFSSELGKANIQYTSDVPTNVQVRGSKTVFERIIMNLLINSLEELEDKAYIGVIEVVGEMTKNSFDLTFKDNGTGLQPQVMKKIFKERVSTKAGNRGLGLYYVKVQMQSHFDGDVEVFNSDNGAKFVLTFPQ